jgi:hypothetical protein
VAFDFGSFSHCPPSLVAPAQPVISEKTTAVEKEKLLTDYGDSLALYESQFHAYMTCLDDMENIVELDQAHQMWTFL